MTDELKIAVPKGRILGEALPLLARAGIEPTDDPNESRKLVLDTNRADIKLVILRAADVPTYVEYGAAELGITGKDILLEMGRDAVYEPLDLGIGKCRLMVAGREGQKLNGRRMRVATKYVNTTRRHFARQGIQVEPIKLYGSMELAPLVGLADFIVDLVDTGNTLKANGLVPMETLAEISSRLIVNKAAMKMKHSSIRALIKALRLAIEQPGAGHD